MMISIMLQSIISDSPWYMLISAWPDEINNSGACKNKNPDY